MMASSLYVASCSLCSCFCMTRDASVEDLGQSNLSLEDLTALSNIVERVAKSLDDR